MKRVTTLRNLLSATVMRFRERKHDDGSVQVLANDVEVRGRLYNPKGLAHFKGFFVCSRSVREIMTRTPRVTCQSTLATSGKVCNRAHVDFYARRTHIL